MQDESAFSEAACPVGAPLQESFLMRPRKFCLSLSHFFRVGCSSDKFGRICSYIKKSVHLYEITRNC